MVCRFLAVFLSLGFAAKVLGEVVHEVLGHGLFVLVFGGRTTGIKISLLWPYELSHIAFSPPSGGFEAWQQALVDGGGLLMCLVVSFASQLVLLLSFSRRGHWVVSSLLFWLAFWTFINPAGYLVVAGIEPFGDVAKLISQGVMTERGAFAAGLVLFGVNLFSLSIILRKVLRNAGVKEDASWSIVLFWLIVPALTLASVLGQDRSPLIAALGLIPVLAVCGGLLLHNAILWRRRNRKAGV
ncbi:MAG: hypothetical protein ACLFVD_01285 [Dehalococcoidia bacterium]